MLKASERFIKASGSIDPDVVKAKCESETKRLCIVMGKLGMDHDAATDVLEALADASSVFSHDQRLRISRVAQGVMSDEVHLATTVNKEYSSEQSLLKSYEYYPEAVWTAIKSSDAIKNKFRQVANFLVDVLQCRNPDAQSKRIIVSTIHAASKLDPPPEDAYADVRQLSEVSKQVRDGNRGPQSLKTFPDDPTEFVSRYPTAYPEDMPPVESKVNPKDILSRANKQVTPLRSNNQKLKGSKKHQGSIFLASQASQNQETRMNPAMMQRMMMMNPMMQMMRRQMMANFINGNTQETDGSDDSLSPLITILGGNRSGGSRDRHRPSSDAEEEVPPPG